MSTLVQFWAADGPKGETLINEHRCKVIDALNSAAIARPERCVLVTLWDTRLHGKGGRVLELWRRPGYKSETGTGPGLLNFWKQYI